MSVQTKASRAGLYHKDITPWIRYISRGRVELNYSRHTALKAQERGLPLPAAMVIESNVIEAELDDVGDVLKLVVRLRWTESDDLCVVVREQPFGSWLVVTMWSNSRTDMHTTLDRSKYRAA